MSLEQRAKLSERAREQHAVTRGFAIPADKREQYQRLRRIGIKDNRLWAELGLPMPKWLTNA